jgi:probable rRNA maturation factor
LPDIRVSARARAPLSGAGVRRLAGAVLKAEGAKLNALSITFVGPARMRTLNLEHLGHDRPTDVLAFGMTLVGDVYVCPAVAVRDAKHFGSTPKDEVRRLVIHGILHVLGYDHPDGNHRTASAMWHVQERHLARFGRLAP